MAKAKFKAGDVVRYGIEGNFHRDLIVSIDYAKEHYTYKELNKDGTLSHVFDEDTDYLDDCELDAEYIVNKQFNLELEELLK